MLSIKELMLWIMVLEKTLETVRRSNQSILKEVNTEYSLKGLMLKLNFPTLVTWSKELTNWKGPHAGSEWVQEEKGTTENEMFGWHHRQMDMSLSKLWKIVKEREAWCTVVHGVAKSQIRLSNWKTTTNHSGNTLWFTEVSKTKSKETDWFKVCLFVF